MNHSLPHLRLKNRLAIVTCPELPEASIPPKWSNSIVKYLEVDYKWVTVGYSSRTSISGIIIIIIFMYFKVLQQSNSDVSVQRCSQVLLHLRDKSLCWTLSNCKHQTSYLQQQLLLNLFIYTWHVLIYKRIANGHPPVDVPHSTQYVARLRETGWLGEIK